MPRPPPPRDGVRAERGVSVGGQHDAGVPELPLRLWVPRTRPLHATCAYSWISLAEVVTSDDLDIVLDRVGEGLAAGRPGPGSDAGDAH